MLVTKLETRMLYFKLEVLVNEAVFYPILEGIDRESWKTFKRVIDESLDHQRDNNQANW